MIRITICTLKLLSDSTINTRLAIGPYLFTKKYDKMPLSNRAIFEKPKKQQQVLRRKVKIVRNTKYVILSNTLSSCQSWWDSLARAWTHTVTQLYTQHNTEATNIYAHRQRNTYRYAITVQCESDGSTSVSSIDLRWFLNSCIVRVFHEWIVYTECILKYRGTHARVVNYLRHYYFQSAVISKCVTRERELTDILRFSKPTDANN